MSVIIYHNPRCSKSRQTLALLQEHGLEPVVLEYLKDTLDFEALSVIHEKLGGSAQLMLRSKEPEYKDSGLHQESSDKDILEAIAAHPKLLERPIVVTGNKAAIGRPPEAVLDIL